MPIPFVSEDIIDYSTAGFSESEEHSIEIIKELEEQQPVLLGYLFSENFRLLTQEERDYMLYLALVIWESVQRVQPTTGLIGTEEIEEKEEINWEILHESSARRFKERLDGFFDNTTQEDLLAFVEDALVDEDQEEEENIVTKEGKGLLFIGLKTVIDCLCD